jgi:hypothetical protein
MSNQVLSIEETLVDKTRVTVTAMVDDVYLLHHQTIDSPAEYAPALCTASFEMEEDEQIPLDENNFCKYLEELCLEWQLVEFENFN